MFPTRLTYVGECYTVYNIAAGQNYISFSRADSRADSRANLTSGPRPADPHFFRDEKKPPCGGFQTLTLSADIPHSP